MSTQLDIAQRVRKVIADVACKPVEQVTDEAILATDLDMDSLDDVVLDADLEDEFGFRFEDNEGADLLETVGEVIAMVQRKVAP